MQKRMEATTTTANRPQVCRQCKATIEQGSEFMHVVILRGDVKVDSANACMTCASAAGLV